MQNPNFVSHKCCYCGCDISDLKDIYRSVLPLCDKCFEKFISAMNDANTPRGEAVNTPDFDSAIRWFESSRGCHLFFEL